jgi:dihydropyrimidine dehydrogenase (NAD+) subunit PreA
MANSEAPNLELTFAGMKFKSPIGVGAVGRPMGKNCTPALHADVLLKHVEAGASYINLPTCDYATEETLRKIEAYAKPFKMTGNNRGMPLRISKAVTPAAPYGVEGIYTFGWPGWADPVSGKAAGEHVEEVLKIVQDRMPSGTRIIANIRGYSDLPDSWVDAAKRWEYLGVDLIEINVSCPAYPGVSNALEDFEEKRFSAHWYGSVMGETPEAVEKITREVVKAVRIPVGVKLTPETGMLRAASLARRIQAAGAKWIASVNSGITVAPPDIFNRGKPMWSFSDGNPFIGTAGSWLRHISYKHVAAFAKFAPGLDISAAGGLVLPQHVVEIMMLGARQVQLCTGVIEKGRNFIRQCNSYLKKFMVEQGYHSLEEIVGLGQSYVKFLNEVKMSPEQYISVTDETKCTNCGVCADNICIARYMENGAVKVRAENCSGCGCCTVGCPSNAIKMVKVA